MRTAGRLLILMLMLPAACIGAKERADLCADLQHLRATIAEISAPTGSVGELRGALQALRPTIDATERSGDLPDAAASSWAQTQEAALEVLDGVGDDGPVSSVPEAESAGRAVQGAFVATEGALGCLEAPS